MALVNGGYFHFMSIVWKTMWEKDKMLVTSILSFPHKVFKGHLHQGHQKSGLSCKELRHYEFYHSLDSTDSMNTRAQNLEKQIPGRV